MDNSCQPALGHLAPFLLQQLFCNPIPLLLQIAWAFLTPGNNIYYAFLPEVLPTCSVLYQFYI